MNVKNLSDMTAKEVGVTQATAKAVVDAFIDNIVEVLAAGETVRVKGVFTLSVVRCAAKERRNPQDGTVFMGKPTARIRCKTSKTLKEFLRDKA